MSPRQSFIDLAFFMKTLAPTTFFEQKVTLEDFWNNEYISQQMLKAHLDPNTDAASRKPEFIQKSIDWIVEQLDLRPGQRILDLGCGPGLYTNELSKRGYSVTGIDFSRRSINYAREQAQKEQLNVEYIQKNYLTIDYENEFDVILMIYCDFGVFSDENRDTILKKIHRALKPNGVFVFDVWTKFNEDLTKTSKDWTIHPDRGFFADVAHIELVNNVHFREMSLQLNQYVILDQYGNTTIYNLWERLYSVKGLVDLLRPYGFQGVKLAGDLTGTEYTETSRSIGALVRALKN